MNKLDRQACKDIGRNRYIKEGYNKAKAEILAELLYLPPRILDGEAVIYFKSIKEIIERLNNV